MADFVTSGRIIDAILVLMVVEAVLLQLHARRTGRGLAGADIVINLIAGGSLMLAVRAALVGAAPLWIVACLSVSLLAHVADVTRRWRAGRGEQGSDRARGGAGSGVWKHVHE